MTVLSSAPRQFDLHGSARTLCSTFAARAGTLTALTDQPLAIRRMIPFRIHGHLDTPFVPTLLLLP